MDTSRTPSPEQLSQIEKQLTPVDAVLSEMDDSQIPSEVELPSRFRMRQVVSVQFSKLQRPLIGTVRGVHFFPGKVKYDVGLWLDDGSSETRIYNVDSVFVVDLVHSSELDENWKPGKAYF